MTPEVELILRALVPQLYSRIQIESDGSTTLKWPSEAELRTLGFHLREKYGDCGLVELIQKLASNEFASVEAINFGTKEAE
jgi:hypothetical protein